MSQLRRFRRSFGLRGKFLLSLTAVVLATVIGSFVFIQGHIRFQMESSIRDDLRRTSQVFHNFLEERYEYLASQSMIIAQDPKFFASVAELDRTTAYREGLGFQELVKADLFMVTDGDGRLLFEIGYPQKALTDESLLPLVQSALSGATSSGLVEHEGGISQAVCVPVLVKGQLIGTLTVGYYIDNNLAKKIKGATNSETAFFKGEKVIASTLVVEDMEAVCNKLWTQEKGQDAAALPNQTWEGVLGSDKEEFIYLHDYLGEGKSQTNISFLMLRSLNATLDPYMTKMRSFMLTIAMAGVLFSFLVSVFISNNLTSSVKSLVEAARRVAKGEYGAPILVKSRDEMAELASAFNEMSRSLEKHITELKQANTDLLHSERLAAVGKVAAAVVHDFKNPMAVISVALEALDLKFDDQASRRKYIEMIKNEIHRIIAMTQDILEFSRGENSLTLNITKWNLSKVLEQLLASLADNYMTSNIKLNFRSSYSGYVVADQYRILRVFNNLLSNAKEAMTTGGEIMVEVEGQGQNVIIRFRDTGPGIPQEIKSKLFEAFITFGKASGTGLGLAISKKIVEEHGGQIAFESHIGRGTTFTVTLPQDPRVQASPKEFEGSLALV